MLGKCVASEVFYLLPHCAEKQTKGEMRRKYNSFHDLRGHFRLHDDLSMDSLQEQIEMNPNGSDALSLQRHNRDGTDDDDIVDCFRAWPSSQALLLLLRPHNFKLKVYYTSVDNCVHCNKR